MPGKNGNLIVKSCGFGFWSKSRGERIQGLYFQSNFNSEIPEQVRNDRKKWIYSKNLVALTPGQARGDRFRVFYFQSNFNSEIPEQIRNDRKASPE